ncbi:MAG: hypothetical protein ABFR50_03190 [Candidatus Fermentibacteria bacterium]
MNRFSEKYEKPELIPLNQGLNRGWLATCQGGGTPGSAGSCVLGGVPDFVQSCVLGAVPDMDTNSDFINSDYMQQTENSSTLLTD